MHLAKQVSPYDNEFNFQSRKEATFKDLKYLLFEYVHCEALFSFDYTKTD